METTVELAHYIGETFPELSGIYQMENCRNAYDIAYQLIRYTRDQLSIENYFAAEKCFLIAQQIYESGNKTVRNAIENVFVFSFSHTLFHGEGGKNKVWQLIPIGLKDIYTHQVLASHL